MILLLTYINRSGSTYFVNQLSKHPGIIVLPEGEILVKELLIRTDRGQRINTRELFSSDSKLKHWKIDHARLPVSSTSNVDLFFKILQSYREQNQPDASVIVFKAWELIQIIQKIPSEIISLYQVKFIALTRDIRAVVSSQKRTSYMGKPLENNTLSTINKWRAFVRKIETSRDRLSLISYESLIQKTKNIIEFSLSNSGIFFHPELLGNEGTVRKCLSPKEKDLHPYIDLPPLVERIDSWQHELNEVDVYLIQQLARKEMKKMGYDPIPTNSPIITAFFTYIKYLAGLTKTFIQQTSLMK